MKRESFLAIAKTGKTRLKESWFGTARDHQDVEESLIIFGEDVEVALRDFGDFESANVISIMRRYSEAMDARGINKLHRNQRLDSAYEWYLENVRTSILISLKNTSILFTKQSAFLLDLSIDAA